MNQLIPRKWRREMEQPLQGLQREMNRLMEGFLGHEAAEGEWFPKVDISETDNEVNVKAELPGLDKGDVDVSISGDMLTIRGEKKEEHKDEKEGRYRVHERRYGSFHRSVALPAGVDSEKAAAEFKNGVLSIKLPKTEETKTRKIAIKEQS